MRLHGVRLGLVLLGWVALWNLRLALRQVWPHPTAGCRALGMACRRVGRLVVILLRMRGAERIAAIVQLCEEMGADAAALARHPALAFLFARHLHVTGRFADIVWVLGPHVAGTPRRGRFGLPGLRGLALSEAHRLLAHALAMQGLFDRALAHAFQCHCVQRYGQADSRVLAGKRPDDALGSTVWIEAHEFLAEELINLSGDYTAALHVYRRHRAEQHRFAARFGLSPRTLYLSEDWVRNIGHIALIDFVVKTVRLGWRSCDNVVLLAPAGSAANPWYAAYWKEHLTVIDDPHMVAVLRPIARALGNRVAGMLELPDGSAHYFCAGMGRVQEAWHRAGRGPLLALSPADREFGVELLRELGVPAGAWFVALHVRTPGFYREGAGAFNHHRNADVLTYLPAMAEIVRRGGWVIRLGDPSMPVLPAVPGVIDYAHSPLRSPRADVFLCAACRFFVGVTSGMTHVPPTFGVPCLSTNWSSESPPTYGKDDLYLPKLLRSTADGRVLPFAEMYAPAVRRLTSAWGLIAGRGLETVDNTPEELRAVVVEMIDRLEGRAEDSDADRRRQDAFAAICRGHGLDGFPRVGRDFLRRHAHLLEPGSTRAAA
jgi:putative glycosyltransferase (TIGR04372 family)